MPVTMTKPPSLTKHWLLDDICKKWQIHISTMQRWRAKGHVPRRYDAEGKNYLTTQDVLDAAGTWENLSTVEEMMVFFQVSKRTLAEWRKQGHVPFIKLFDAIRFSRSAIDKFLEQCEVTNRIPLVDGDPLTEKQAEVAQKIEDELAKHESMTSMDIVVATGASPATVRRVLGLLLGADRISREGNTRGTRWRVS